MIYFMIYFHCHSWLIEKISYNPRAGVFEKKNTVNMPGTWYSTILCDISEKGIWKWYNTHVKIVHTVEINGNISFLKLPCLTCSYSRSTLKWVPFSWISKLDYGYNIGILSILISLYINMYFFIIIYFFIINYYLIIRN